MKRVVSLFLALVLCLSLCACEIAIPTKTEPNVNIQTNPEQTQPAVDGSLPPDIAEPTEPAHTHEWNDATCTEPKTCKTCNETEGSAIGHNWKEATCTEAKTCTVCGYAEGTAGGHQWKDATCLAPKTCSVCNVTEGANGEHNYKDATCTEPKECKVCGATSGKALGCTAGTDGNCVRCGKSMIAISDVLSKPMDSISEIKRFVSSYYTGDCYNVGNFRLMFNSANGVILSWGATNTSSKEIKYITFKICYYNRVGDPAYDSITGKSSYTARMTGPVGAGKSFYFRGLIGYGNDIYYGVITDVKIEYMDGTVVSGNYGQTTWHNIRTGASPKECFVIEN